MKIIKNDYVLIQKRDLGLLPSLSSLDIKYYIDFKYGLEYIKIDNENLMKEIKEADYIIDYDKYIKKGLDELNLERQNAENELIRVSVLSNKTDDFEELESLNEKCKILINLANELLNISLLKKDSKEKKKIFSLKRFKK